MLEIVMGVLFFGAIILYIMARYGSLFHKPPIDPPSHVSSSEKLFDSKTNDVTFFDGESEDYARARSDTRNVFGN